MLVGLGEYGDTCRGFGANHSNWVLILTEHFELFGFAVWSFISLLASTVILFLLKTGERQREHGDKAESPPNSTTPSGMID